MTSVNSVARYLSHLLVIMSNGPEDREREQIERRLEQAGWTDTMTKDLARKVPE